MSLGGVNAGKGKAPSGKLGKKKHKKKHDKEEAVGLEGEDGGLVALQKRDDTNDKVVRRLDQERLRLRTLGRKAAPILMTLGSLVPTLERTPDTKPVASTQDTTPRPLGSTPPQLPKPSRQHLFGRPRTRSCNLRIQDYCENKLTLAVRADCPLHLVKGWLDERPLTCTDFVWR